MARTKKVAINGLGRIGRATLKIVHDEPELELVAVNDIAPLDNIAYLLRYDTAYGRYGHVVEVEGDGKDGAALVVDGTRYRYLSEKDPADLPWEELEVDLVFECTGLFTDRQALDKHLQAGAGYVVLSAPEKGTDLPYVVFGTNQPPEGERIVSCASCTTNCITPVIEVLDRRLGVAKATMTTAHAYTSSQAIVDGPASKVRRGRAGAANLVPTSTGAAKATTRVLPELDGRFDGAAIRAPIPVGSVADIVVVLEREATADEVNRIFREEAESERYAGVLGVTDEPLVSSDIVQDPRASIVDLEMTQVVGGDLLKVMSWYDNEWGYSSQMVRTAEAMLAR